MTYIIIKVGDDRSIFANADCNAQVLLDWLRDRVAPLLPPMAAELDLCDESGNVRLLYELPASTNALCTLQFRGIYYPVVRQTVGKAAGTFRLLQLSGTQDKHRDLQQRINRGVVIWERLKQRLGRDTSHEKLLDAIQKAIARSTKGGSTSIDPWDSVRERGASLKKERRSTRSPSQNGSWSDTPSESRTSRKSDGGGTSGSSRDRHAPNRQSGSHG